MGSKRVKSYAKAAEGLALQTVVIAAIALIVLIIVVAIFKGGLGDIVPKLGYVNDCVKGKQGQCVEAGKCDSGTEVYGLGCEKENLDKDGNPASPYCCIKKQNG